MRISLPVNQFFDDQGFPLVAGSVSIFKHDSDILETVYTLSGDIYTEAQNPIHTDNDGRIPTLFFDAAVVDVWVSKHVGGHQYEVIDTFQAGFNVPSATNDTVVNGIDGLKDSNPELGIVTVYGYDSDCIAPTRNYVWDPTCNADADDGIIVLSNTTETGRWILLWDDEKLPCSVYGITPGHEANISAFLTYPNIVSQWNIRTPKIPRFTQGTYTSDTTFSTTKTLYFDQGAKFESANFVCASVIIPYNNDYVADFTFNVGFQPVAESRWFRTVRGFWQCGAKELRQSDLNFFEDVNIGSAGTICAVLTDRKITGKALLVMDGAANLEFVHCNIGDYALSTTWYTVFKNCDFTDRWFCDASWDFGTDVSHRQLVRSTENRVSLDHFADANVFVLQQAANGIQALDLQNRVVAGITGDMPFVLIRNAVIDYAHFNHHIALENCTVNHLMLENHNLNLTTKNCQATVENATVGNWNDTRSSFSLACDIDTYYATLNWNGTSVNLGGHRLGRAEDDLLYTKQIVMWGCVVNDGTIASSNPVFLDCNIANTLIYVYPGSIYEAESQRFTWSISMEFRNNRFNAAAGIRIGGNNGLSDHIGEVFECRLDSLAITDNVFNTTVSGITCPFWSGPGMAYRFLRGMTAYVPGTRSVTDRSLDYFEKRYEYRGNDGNCPRQYGRPTNGDLPGARVLARNWGNGGTANAMYFENGVEPCRVFVLPAVINETFEPLPEPTVENSVYLVSSLSVCTPYRAKALFSTNQNAGMCADFPVSGYMPLCAADKSLPNDMFDVLVGSWGESAQFFGVNPISSGE